MSFARLPQVVKPGDRLFLNDGLVQLVVERVAGNDVHCKVAVGGELRSRKGLNLPGIDLGISAFTDHDRACLEFALKHGVDAVSQSFVETAADIEAVRAAAKAIGKQPFIIAKIERVGRARALRRDPEGGRRHHGGARRPRRGSADRGDRHPAEAAHRQGQPRRQAGHHRHADARIHDRPAACPRAPRPPTWPTPSSTAPTASCSRASRRWASIPRKPWRCWRGSPPTPRRIARPRGSTICRRCPASTSRRRRPRPSPSVVEHALETVPCAAVFVPTRTGTTARMISRFNPPVWIVALSRDAAVCQGLAFSYGVHPVDAGRRSGELARLRPAAGCASTRCPAPSPCWWPARPNSTRTPTTASSSCVWASRSAGAGQSPSAQLNNDKEHIPL